MITTVHGFGAADPRRLLCRCDALLPLDGDADGDPGLDYLANTNGN